MARMGNDFQVRSCFAIATAAGGLYLSSCGQAPSALAPHGPAAAQIADLWWFMLALGGLVWGLFSVLLYASLFHRRPEGAVPRPTELPPQQLRRANLGILSGGILLPVVVLSA